MTSSPERIKKPEEPTSVRERAMQTGKERRERLGEKIKKVRDSLDILLGSDQFAKEGFKKSREALKTISVKIGKRMEIASESLREKAEKAKGHALTRLAGLKEKARSYGRSSTEGMRGRIEEISLATKKSSFERELRKIRGEKGRVTSITVEGIDERKGRTSKVADTEWLAFLLADIKRVEGIDERAKATSERIRTFSWRIEAIRNKRVRGVEARRAVMALRATGIDMGYKV